MPIGLLLALFPGLAIAKTLDKSGDLARHLLLTPAFGMLALLGISGICFILELDLTAITACAVIANLAAIVSIRTEVQSQKFSSTINRGLWFWIFTFIALILAVQPLLYQRPMGVDWVGFSVLTDSVSSGSFRLEHPSIGNWVYPPAFPTLAAWLDGDAYETIFYLGTVCFASLLLGIAAIGDKLGCSHWVIMSMMLAPALFAKNLDSGYPTIASQLGIVVVLTMFGHRLNWNILGFTIVFVSLIHPTGLIYLITLILAKLLVDKGRKFTINEKIPIVILISSFSVVTISLIPLFSTKAIFSEYGWQGGSPLIVYSGLLLPLAIWSSWSLRKEKLTQILVVWFSLNWILSFISFLDGVSGLPVVSMLSYALYSMSMHAFHIPLAVIVGLKFSKFEITTPSVSTKAIMITALIFSGVAHSSLTQLEDHDELHVISDGDISLFNYINKMELASNTVIYVENEHWGHFFYGLDRVGVTAVPSVGILKQEKSIQNLATSAIIHDNITKLSDLGITYAIASPKGIIMQYIHKSIHWKQIYSSGGSSLYALEDDSVVSTFLPVPGEEMRIDPWKDLRDLDPFDLGERRWYISEGTHNIETNFSESNEMCLMTEFIGKVSLKINNIIKKGSGWHEFCFDSNTTNLELTMISDYEYWLNPLGASGRGDKLLDKTGVRIHWLEVRHSY